MPKDYTRLPLNRVRRADRAVDDDAWIRRFLREAPVGVLATALDGQPFLNSNLFVFDEDAHAIYLHSARVGRTPGNVGAGDRDGRGAPVCFSVFRMGRMLPAAAALNFSVEYAGVSVFGRAHLVADVAEARRGLQALLDKYAPHLQSGRDYQPITDEEIARTAVYRIDVESWSGKQKAVPADFQGAYYYGTADRASSDIAA